MMISQGVSDAWISLNYNHTSNELVWGNSEFGINGSQYYINNLSSYKCTDCNSQHGYSPAIIQKDGSWRVVDENYVSKAVVCMDFDEVEDEISLGHFILYGVPQVFEFEKVNSEEPVSWSNTAEMCYQYSGDNPTLAPVSTSYLQRKVSNNILPSEKRQI